MGGWVCLSINFGFILAQLFLVWWLVSAIVEKVVEAFVWGRLQAVVVLKVVAQVMVEVFGFWQRLG